MTTQLWPNAKQGDGPLTPPLEELAPSCCMPAPKKRAPVRWQCSSEPLAMATRLIVRHPVYTTHPTTKLTKLA